MDRGELHGFSTLSLDERRTTAKGQFRSLLGTSPMVADERTIPSARALEVGFNPGYGRHDEEFCSGNLLRLPPLDGPQVFRFGTVAVCGVLLVFAAVAFVKPTQTYPQDLFALDVIGLAQEHFVNNDALHDEKIEIVGYVSWRTHPRKCWDVSHSANYSVPHSGLPLRIHDCVAEPDKFLIPVKGTGPIRIVKDALGNTYPFCLDSPRGTELQFWNCSQAPQKNVLFLPNSRGMGTYRLEKNLSMCVDVPNNDAKNGKMLQMWNCRAKTFDQHFSVHAPVNCEWGEWGEWAKCSALCDGGERKRARAKAYGVTVQKSSTGQNYFYALKKLDRSHGGGKECSGSATMGEHCNTHHCSDSQDSRVMISEPDNVKQHASDREPETTKRPVKSSNRGLHGNFMGLMLSALLLVSSSRTSAMF